MKSVNHDVCVSKRDGFQTVLLIELPFGDYVLDNYRQEMYKFSHLSVVGLGI